MEELELALLKAIWIARWNSNKTAKYAVLTEDEALQISKDIIKELDKAGYKITRRE
jgi:hypothetical protein